MRESRKEYTDRVKARYTKRFKEKYPNSSIGYVSPHEIEDRKKYLLSIAPKIDMPDISAEGDLNKLQDMNLSELSRAVNTPLPPRERTPHFITNESYNEELFAEGSKSLDDKPYVSKLYAHEDYSDVRANPEAVKKITLSDVIAKGEKVIEEKINKESEFIDQYFGRVLTQEDVEDIKNEWKKPVVVDLNTEDSDPW